MYNYNAQQRISPEVRKRKEERLEHLQRQAASYGVDVPAHVATEIEDLQRELEIVAMIEQRPLDPRLRAELNQTNHIELLVKFIADHGRRLTGIEQWQAKREIEIDRQREVTERQTRIGSFIFGVMIVLLVMGLLFNLIILADMVSR